MISSLLLGIAILAGVIGVALLLARVWMAGFGKILDPERQQFERRQLAAALAMVAFAALFFLGRGVGESSSADPVAADPQPAPADRGDEAALTRLAVAARLPSLRSGEGPRNPGAERPSPAESEPAPAAPAAEEVPVASPPPEDVEPAAEPTPPPAPAPTPPPAPAPAPEPPPPVAFDDSG